MKNKLKAIWAWLRKLPIAQYIKPIWKGLLSELFQSESDKMRERVKEIALTRGVEGLNSLIDQWQESVKKGLARLPISEGIKVKAIGIVDDSGDRLQEQLIQAIQSGGGAVLIDQAFGRLDGYVRGRIAQL